MLKILNVIDEFTREALATDVDRSIDADGVVALPRAPGRRARRPGLRALRPRPRVHRPRAWPTGAGSTGPAPCSSTRAARGRTPGSSRSTAGMRDEHLNGQQFDSLLEAQVLTEDWRIDYNMNRPHSAHGWLTPGRVRRGLAQPTAATARIAGGSTIGVLRPSAWPSSWSSWSASTRHTLCWSTFAITRSPISKRKPTYGSATSSGRGTASDLAAREFKAAIRTQPDGDTAAEAKEAIAALTA